MAIVSDNDITTGLRGKFGNLFVFRSLRGKTIVSRRAQEPDKAKETMAQRQTRATFRDAAQWAKTILLDPKRKAYYQQRARALKLPNAYTAAITDFMRKPQVSKLQRRGMITYRVIKRGFTLSDVRINSSKDETQRSTLLRDKDAWVLHAKEDIDDGVTFAITDNTSREFLI
jgi:hypothetical protein